jgi:cytokinin riboside 5'-monophosphate phosphoribohydrolase
VVSYSFPISLLKKSGIQILKKTICVYSSSSDAVDNGFVAAARELGALIGQRRYTLIFGAGRIGLMGQVAGSVQEHGGRVIGVIPQYLNQFGITYEKSDELIVTADMRERKAVMEKQADAFIALPGGFGTLEEILEVITLKQLQLHRKPIIFLNTLRFYDHLLQQFQHLFQESFAKKSLQKAYAVVDNARQAMDYIETYEPPELQQKWF